MFSLNLSIFSIRAFGNEKGGSIDRLSCDLKKVKQPLLTSELSVWHCTSRGWMCASGVHKHGGVAKASHKEDDDDMEAYTHTGVTDRISEYVSTCSADSRRQ